MKKYIYTVSLLISSFLSFAQHATIKGVIKSESDNSPIPYVSINMDGAVSKNSDIKGNYQFNDVSAGEHKISFSFLGYEKNEITVKISEENQVIDLTDLKLKPSAVLISEVVITSPSTNFSSRYEGSNVIISSKEIELTKPIGTEELLKKVAELNDKERD